MFKSKQQDWHLLFVIMQALVNMQDNQFQSFDKE